MLKCYSVLNDFYSRSTSFELWLLWLGDIFETNFLYFLISLISRSSSFWFFNNLTLIRFLIFNFPILFGLTSLFIRFMNFFKNLTFIWFMVFHFLILLWFPSFLGLFLWFLNFFNIFAFFAFFRFYSWTNYCSFIWAASSIAFLTLGSMLFIELLLLKWINLSKSFVSFSLSQSSTFPF